MFSRARRRARTSSLWRERVFKERERDIQVGESLRARTSGEGTAAAFAAFFFSRHARSFSGVLSKSCDPASASLPLAEGDLLSLSLSPFGYV